MNIETLREYCLQKEAVTESFPFGEDVLVFKVMNKIFALISLNKPDYVNLKCDPNRAIELRAEFPDAIQPGFHMNKSLWNTVQLNAKLPQWLLHQLIDHSYEEVIKKMPKKDRAMLIR
jgi:predicted DNA-binding protein (MmcQ/YjbR family)